MTGKGNILEQQSFKSHMEKYKMDYNIVQLTCEATGVSIPSVKKILKEDKTDSRTDPAFSMPKKRRKLPERNEQNNFMEITVRRTIQEFCDVTKQQHSLNKTLQYLEKDKDCTAIMSFFKRK
jgi:hypothetical protein